MNTPRPLRVLQLMRSLDPVIGGPLTYLRTLEQALAGRACTVQIGPVASPSLNGWLRKNLSAVDVVHIHGIYGWHTLLGAQACAAAGKPFVVSSHGHLHPYALSQKAWKKNLYLSMLGRAALRRSRAIVVTTRAEAEAVRAFDAGLESILIAPGLEVPEKPLAQLHTQKRSGDLHLAYLGRLHPHKNLPLLFRALAALQKEGAGVRLTLIGDGEPHHVAALRSEAQALGIEPLLHFTGFLSGPAKAAALCEADALVLPSHSENFSFAVAEALALGLPALVSREVGLADTIQRHDCGSVFAPDDADALAAAVAGLRPLAHRRALGQRAYAAALKELSLKKMGDELMQLYSSLAREPGR